jgi:hypothetical protein
MWTCGLACQTPCTDRVSRIQHPAISRDLKKGKVAIDDLQRVREPCIRWGCLVGTKAALLGPPVYSPRSRTLAALNGAPSQLRIWETQQILSPGAVQEAESHTNLAIRHAWVSELRPSGAARNPRWWEVGIRPALSEGRDGLWPAIRREVDQLASGYPCFERVRSTPIRLFGHRPLLRLATGGGGGLKKKPGGAGWRRGTATSLGAVVPNEGTFFFAGLCWGPGGGPHGS